MQLCGMRHVEQDKGFTTVVQCAAHTYVYASYIAMPDAASVVAWLGKMYRGTAAGSQ